MPGKSSVHFQLFWWMVWKYQNELHRKHRKMHLSSKVMRTQRTLKSRWRCSYCQRIAWYNVLPYPSSNSHHTRLLYCGVLLFICASDWLEPSSEPRIFHIFMEHCAIFDAWRPMEIVCREEAPTNNIWAFTPRTSEDNESLFFCIWNYILAPSGLAHKR